MHSFKFIFLTFKIITLVRRKNTLVLVIRQGWFRLADRTFIIQVTISTSRTRSIWNRHAYFILSSYIQKLSLIVAEFGLGPKKKKIKTPIWSHKHNCRSILVYKCKMCSKKIIVLLKYLLFNLILVVFLGRVFRLFST